VVPDCALPDCALHLGLSPLLLPPFCIPRYPSFHLPLTRIAPEQLGKQPECLTASVDSSREVLQPGRIHQPATADKAADAQQKRSGLGKEAAPSTCAQRGRVSNSNQQAAPAKRAAKASPLDPIQPIFVHPDVKDANSCHTLLLPPPSHRCAPQALCATAVHSVLHAFQRARAHICVGGGQLKHPAAKVCTDDDTLAIVPIYIPILD
jgi:hypothetical protein